MNSLPNKAEALVVRSRLLQWFAFGIAVLMGFSLLFLTIQRGFSLLPGWFGVVTALSLIAGYLANRRFVLPATVLLFAGFSVTLLLIVIDSNEPTRDALMIMPFFLLQLPAAALLFNSRAALWVGGLGLLMVPAVLIGTPAMEKFPGLPAVLFFSIATTAAITWITVRLLERSLRETEDRAIALAKSEEVAQEAALEAQAQSKNAEDRRQYAEKTLRELRATMLERDSLAKSLQEATLPILPVHEKVLVMPLVGAIDTHRANLLNDTMLNGIERSHARVIIVDVTGVPLIDTQVAGALLRSAAAARLLGARVILVGVRPEVAQTIIGLGLDLSELIVCNDLQTGIETGLNVLQGKRSQSYLN